MTKPLELADDHEENGTRPEWCPEAVWPALREKCTLFKIKILRCSVEQLAESFGFEVGRVRSLLQTASWRLNIQKVREQLEQAAYIGSGKAQSLFLEALEDKVRMGKATARDLAIIAKNQADMALNLGNGAVGSPAIGTVNFNDIKAAFSVQLKKPGEI